MTEETTEQLTDGKDILQAILERLDSFEKNTNDQFKDILKRFDDADIQFEAIRTGIAANNIAFERLTGKVYLMSANLAEMQENMGHRLKKPV